MTGSIAGRVLDPSGAPVSGASVAVSGGTGAVNDIAALTDAEGRFRLGNLPPGRYNVAVFGNDTAEAGTEVDIAEGEQRETEIRFGGEAGSDPAGGVRLVTDAIDWGRVRLVRVSLLPAGGEASKEFLFSPGRPGSAVWPATPGAWYTYTVSYFLAGGLQRTVGPTESGDAALILDPAQDNPSP
jgi:hypothetical protein